MKKSLSPVILAAFLILILSNASWAVPTLQLGIVGGTWDPLTQTTVGTTNSFKLYALLVEDLAHGDLTSSTYYISMAVAPAVSTPASLGSFTFMGTPVNVTSDMVFGNPPIETDITKDPGDLASHGIFPTYFTEFAFFFNPSNKIQEFNVQDYPGLDPTTQTFVDKPMYYQEFDIDVSNLDPASVIHFDLYNTFEVQTQVNVPTDVPSAYVPAAPEHCTNGSTSYPKCTLTTSTTQDYPSAYVAGHCKKPGQVGPTCIKNGTPNPGDWVPQSCTNGSTVYPLCTKTTTTSTNYQSAYVKAQNQYCTNGSKTFPMCTTTLIGFVGSGDYDIKSFAPFSHDAEGGPHEEVPEPLTLVSMGIGIVAAELLRRRYNR